MTESYSVVIKRSAEKEIKPIPSGDLKRAIDRIRQGDYRIVYGIDDAAPLVEVVKIRHQREVCR